jgi:hypothetical protein
MDSRRHLGENELTSQEMSMTRKQRFIVSADAWAVAVPLVVAMFFVNVWLGAVFAVIVLFTTWDYIRNGDFGGHSEDSKYGFGSPAHNGTNARPIWPNLLPDMRSRWVRA